MISLYNSVLGESPLDSPFAPKNKCGDILPLFGLIGDVATAGMQQESVERTNQLNAAIANMNNERMIDQFNQQMAEARYQYRKNREYALEDRDYNSPANVTKRLLQAGINPSSYFGQGSTQIASQTGVGVPSAPNLHSPTLQASNIGSMLSGAVGRAINAYNESRLATSVVRKNEATSNNIEASTNAVIQKLPYEVDKLKADSYKEGIEGDVARKNLDFLGKTMDLREKLLYGDLMQQDQALKNMQEDYRGMQLRNDITEITKAYQDKLEQANVALLWKKVDEVQANIGLINANQLLTIEEKNKKVEEVVNQKIVNGLGSIDYDVKKATKDVLINTAREELYSLEDARYERPFRMNREASGKAGQWLPDASTGYGASWLYQKNRKRDRIHGGFYHVP